MKFSVQIFKEGVGQIGYLPVKENSEALETVGF